MDIWPAPLFVQWCFACVIYTSLLFAAAKKRHQTPCCQNFVVGTIKLLGSSTTEYYGISIRIQYSLKYKGAVLLNRTPETFLFLSITLTSWVTWQSTRLRTRVTREDRRRRDFMSQQRSRHQMMMSQLRSGNVMRRYRCCRWWRQCHNNNICSSSARWEDGQMFIYLMFVVLQTSVNFFIAYLYILQKMKCIIHPKYFAKIVNWLIIHYNIIHALFP